jgi:hypothetical protein
LLANLKKNELKKLDVLNILVHIYCMEEWQFTITVHDEGDGLSMGVIIIKS